MTEQHGHTRLAVAAKDRGQVGAALLLNLARLYDHVAHDHLCAVAVGKCARTIGTRWVDQATLPCTDTSAHWGANEGPLFWEAQFFFNLFVRLADWTP